MLSCAEKLRLLRESTKNPMAIPSPPPARKDFISHAIKRGKTVYLHADLHRVIRETADEAGLKVSALFTIIVRDWIERRGTSPCVIRGDAPPPKATRAIAR